MDIESLHEVCVLVKLFHNEKLQHKYLPTMLTGLFHGWAKEMIFIMKQLNKKGNSITIRNMVVAQASFEHKNFKKKNGFSNPPLSETLISTFVNKKDVDTTTDLFEESLKELHDIAFYNYLNDRVNKIKYLTDYRKGNDILLNVKHIERTYKIMFGHKHIATDDIMSAVEKINSLNTMLPTTLKSISNMIGGFTRGYPVSVIARSGHCKSTLLTFEMVQGILNGTLDSGTILSSEEEASVVWQRVFAMVFRIPVKDMRAGKVKITKEQVKILKDKLDGRLIIKDSLIKFNDIVDYIYSSKSEMILIDHINVIEYPGNGNSMMNMIGGIPSLITKEKQYLAENKETVIINLSQVAEKEMAKTGRKFPSYTDAFGSSILYQAAREFLSLYYPYKDVLANPENYVGKNISPNDYIISIEKNSFGNTGKVNIKYIPEIARFEDVKIVTEANVIQEDLFN